MNPERGVEVNIVSLVVGSLCTAMPAGRAVCYVVLKSIMELL